MKNKPHSLLNPESIDFLVKPQKPLFEVKYVSESAEPDHLLDAPLSKGTEKIIKQFKEDIRKIQTPKTLPSKETKPNSITDSEYYTC